jgi:hypothetical protein
VVAAATSTLVLGPVGCGEEQGVDEGAVVSVYVSAPLSGERAAQGMRTCAGARRALAAAGTRADSPRVRVICLDDTGGGERWSLAAVGANARRAAEDSASIGYIGEPDPAAARFSRPILESAGIPQLTGGSVDTAMARLLRAVRRADEGAGLREAVSDQLSATGR